MFKNKVPKLLFKSFINKMTYPIAELTTELNFTPNFYEVHLLPYLSGHQLEISIKKTWHFSQA